MTLDYTHTMSGRSNNPFAPNPVTEVQQTAQRFPDLSSEVGQLQQQQQQQQQQYTQQQPLQQQQYYQPTGQYNTAPSYLQSQPTGFQPTTSFGQQLQQQQTGYNPTGQQYGQQGGAGAGQYSSSQHYNQSSTPQVSFSVQDLDPYSQGLDSLAQRGNPSHGSTTSANRSLPSNLTTVQQPQSHPRVYLHDPQAKQALTNWDEYAVSEQDMHSLSEHHTDHPDLAAQWKQLLSRVDVSPTNLGLVGPHADLSILVSHPSPFEKVGNHASLLSNN